MEKEQTKEKEEFETSNIFQSEIKKFFSKYEKENGRKNFSIYVIRPQFIVSVITLLKDVAIKTLELKNVLNSTNDKQQINQEFLKFQRGFLDGCEKFGVKYINALSEIDKTINSLQKIKNELIESNNALNNLKKEINGFEGEK